MYKWILFLLHITPALKFTLQKISWFCLLYFSCYNKLKVLCHGWDADLLLHVLLI